MNQLKSFVALVFWVFPVTLCAFPVAVLLEIWWAANKIKDDIHLQLSDIKNPFWKKYIQDTEGMTPLEAYCWMCDNIGEFSKERRVTFPMDPLRDMNNRLFAEGKYNLAISPRHARRLKNQTQDST